jgi:hypothetical protein
MLVPDPSRESWRTITQTHTWDDGGNYRLRCTLQHADPTDSMIRTGPDPRTVRSKHNRLRAAMTSAHRQVRLPVRGMTGRGVRRPGTHDLSDTERMTRDAGFGP